MVEELVREGELIRKEALINKEERSKIGRNDEGGKQWTWGILNHRKFRRAEVEEQ